MREFRPTPSKRLRTTERAETSTAGARLIERGLEEETGDDDAEEEPKPVADILRDMGLAALAFTLVSTFVSPEWVVIVLGVVSALLLVSSAGYRWSGR